MFWILLSTIVDPMERQSKERDWITEKVSHDMRKRGVSAERAFGALKDVIRYTFQYPDDRYADGVRADVERLTGEGFALAGWRNMWGGNTGKGIVSVWRIPSAGEVFEMQFQTAAGFAARQSTFEAYARLRTLGCDGDEVRSLLAYQRSVMSQVAVPDGAVGLELGEGTGVGGGAARGIASGVAGGGADAYYAIVDDYSTPDSPGGVVRRVEDGARDEDFGVDLEWTPSWVLYSWERGNMDRELHEVSEDEANRIVERIRRAVTGRQ